MTLEGQPPVPLQVKGSVEEGSLELLDIDTEQILPCVHFGPAYYGTDKTQAAILYNNGPEPVAFVAVLDEDAVGQEVVGIVGYYNRKLTVLWVFLGSGRN